MPRGDEHRPAEPKPENIMIMMVMMFVFGMVATSILLATLKGVLHFEFGPLMAITMLSFLIMIVMEGVFIRLLFRGRTRDKDKDATLISAQPTIKELEAQSQFPLQPVGSVTEHTTRAFDPVYSERK
ncbi:MAG TPA: hypothetical protein VNG71_15895 [Pyrinomonadaceae bacterium]|nr:hypothetical protein [Pyrinomonadaceae bacterium]